MLIHIIHLSLTFLMLWALYKSGCRISCIQKLSFKAMVKASWLGVLAFTLNEGLRFGRGLDYNIYADHFIIELRNGFTMNMSLSLLLL